MRKLFVFILMLFVPFFVNAEQINMEWQTSWGGNSTMMLNDFFIKETGDIVFFGATTSTNIEGLPNKGKSDSFMIKYGENGNLLWKKSFAGNGADLFNDYTLTETGDIIICGHTNSTDIQGLPNKGSTDAFILKFDKNGNLLWQTSLAGNDSDSITEVATTKDNGIIALGTTSSTDIDGLPGKGGQDTFIAKFDENGILLWQTLWGGNGYDDFANEITQTDNGDIIVYGLSFSTDIDGLSNKGSRDVILVKYDKDGNLLWQKSFGGNGLEGYNGFFVTKEEDIILNLYTDSTDIEGLLTNGDYDVVIVKYDKDGNLLWQTLWGGNGADWFYDSVVTETEDMIFYGYSNSTNIEGLSVKGDDDAVIVKFDKNGNLLWQTSWGGSLVDSFRGIKLTKEEDMFFFGYTSSTDIDNFTNNGGQDAVIVKYDKNGNLLWQNSFGGNGIEEFGDFLLTEDDKIILYGYTNSTNIDGLINIGDKDAFIIKYDEDGNVVWKKNWGGSSDELFKGFYFTKEGNLLLRGSTASKDIEGLLVENNMDVMLVKYNIEYDLKLLPTNNGTATVIQNDSFGIITQMADKGYEVDKIIIKDLKGNVLDVEVTKLEDGTYSFDLYTDVSVEVLFKEKLVNPKTGVVSYIGAVLSILFISIATFCVLVFNKKSYRL